MKTIYYLVDEKGYKDTTYMFTNRKAAIAAMLRREKQHPGKRFHVEIGYAFKD